MTTLFHSIASTNDTALNARGLLAMSRAIRGFDPLGALDLESYAYTEAEQAGYEDGKAGHEMSLQFVGEETLCRGWRSGYELAIELNQPVEWGAPEFI